jgi:hypothetical protein
MLVMMVSVVLPMVTGGSSAPTPGTGVITEANGGVHLVSCG